MKVIVSLLLLAVAVQAGALPFRGQLSALGPSVCTARAGAQLHSCIAGHA
jgi:hypothetical protein